MAVHPHRLVSLCTGYGGLELGLEIAGMALSPLVYVEREAYAAATLVARMEEQAIPAAPIWDCVDTFDAKPLHGIVDGLVGGYPCTPFSIIGKREGLKSEFHLWPHFARIIRECQPRWCFFENVANHLNLGFDVVARELQGMDYRVAATLVTAEEVGAPHKRERVFILAVANEHRARLSAERSCRIQHGEQELGDDVDGCCGETVAGPKCGDCFPPGRDPGDPRWAGWPWPCVESEIRERTDGHPYWSDELRLCGGGVVPLQAAYAFSLLVTDFKGG